MSERRRAVFLGSGAFAVPVFDALAAARTVRLVGVITAPPRAAGRTGAVTTTPVHERATALGLPVLTPDPLRSPDGVASVAALAPELLVLADYGQIVPAALLDLPAFGALNLHPSLLPRHRGASPIPAAILAGDDETGVTLMRMDAGLDTGPIVAQLRTRVGSDETAPALEARLARLAATLLADSLDAWLAGDLPARPQPAAGATLTRPLQREDGRLDPRHDVATLTRMVRAYQPWPGTWFEVGTTRVVVWAAEARAGDDVAATAHDSYQAVGTLVADGDGLAVACSDGQLRLLEVQPAGGRRMSGAALRRGRPELFGGRLAGASLG